jgi:hypothetical protein
MEKPEGKRSLRRLKHEERIIRVLNGYLGSGMGAWTGLIWLRIGIGGGHL